MPYELALSSLSLVEKLKLRRLFGQSVADDSTKKLKRFFAVNEGVSVVLLFDCAQLLAKDDTPLNVIVSEELLPRALTPNSHCKNRSREYFEDVFGSEIIEIVTKERACLVIYMDCLDKSLPRGKLTTACDHHMRRTKPLLSQRYGFQKEKISGHSMSS